MCFLLQLNNHPSFSSWLFKAVWPEGPLEEALQNPREAANALWAFCAFAPSPSPRILFHLISEGCEALNRIRDQAFVYPDTKHMSVNIKVNKVMCSSRER